MYFFSFNAQDGLSALHVASQFGHTEVVDVLLNAGADINQATKVHYHYMYTVWII